MIDFLGKKMDKQYIVVFIIVVDLLLRQNNMKLVVFMDGDLIGVIIQDSSKDDESKNKLVILKQSNIDGKMYNGI